MYYSQHGEDCVLDKIFDAKTNGFFVEVGCVDGRRFSNTLALEEKGWTGLNVEAHTDYIPLLRDNRPNSKTIHAAVCDIDGGLIKFYADRRGSLSSLDQSREVELKRDYSEYFSGFTEQHVPRRTLTSIFDQEKVSEVDVLSIDIEGGEIDALKGLDLNKYKPVVLVIEFGSLTNLRELKKMLKPFGYHLALIVNNNVFFSTNIHLFSKVAGTKITDVTLLHTGNPIDNDSDVVKQVSIDTRLVPHYRNLSKFIEKKLRHTIKNLIQKYD